MRMCATTFVQQTTQLGPWAVASLCHPIRLRLPGRPATSEAAAEGGGFDQTPVISSGDPWPLGALLGIRTHRHTTAIRDTLLWATNLALAFRSLSMAEAQFFELGLESWALRLIRIRAKVIEAFLLLSFQSNAVDVFVTSSGSVHPAICLLEASLNMQIFRAALACGCLSEARKLLPLFSPSVLRTCVAALEQATQGHAGYSNSSGRQACCLSIVTLHRTCCLVPLGELLVTLGEQCLVIGELGSSSLLGGAAAQYMARSEGLDEYNADIRARHVALLATSRLRQGDLDGALQLVHTVTSASGIAELEVPVALDVAEILWVGSSLLGNCQRWQESHSCRTFILPAA